MTLRLILMRHAKSSWEHPGEDFDRPLNPRGRAAAVALGDWLRSAGHLPDEVLCSGAARTRETLALLGLETSPSFHDALYLAPPSILGRTLRQAQGGTVLMVAHNPGIAEFADVLAETPPAHPRFFDYPTGATLVLDFKARTWDAITQGGVVDFIVPRELAG
ncbi:SixA phosphatase family protein [Pseudaestuariivita sp.]|uniref:SixA phosphatase family protein n=1 Tax=Pseudaestuariivita sp. TaxID=2211669 RepID=UPI00405993A6